MSRTKRAALYVRVNTDAQTVENQIRELRQVAKRRGWDVVEVYSDAGISGAKGRNGRPGLDSMLKDASRRKFDIVMAWVPLVVSLGACCTCARRCAPHPRGAFGF